MSTAGVQVHSSNSLCMDTITEAASSEAEEVGQEEDVRGLDEAEAVTVRVAQDVSTAPAGKAKEDLQGDVESGESQAVGSQAEESKEDGKADHTATPSSDKYTVEDAAQTATHTPTRNENTVEDVAEAVTVTESCAAESEAASETPQGHSNAAFVTDDPDSQVVQV